MRDRRRHLVGFSVAALLLAAAAPGAAPASVGLADGVARPRLAEPEAVHRAEAAADRSRARPTDDPDPNRNAYTVPQAPKSPKCGRHFCVHWVAEGIDAPNLADTDGNGVPDFVSRC